MIQTIHLKDIPKLNISLDSVVRKLAFNTNLRLKVNRSVRLGRKKRFLKLISLKLMVS